MIRKTNIILILIALILVTLTASISAQAQVAPKPKKPSISKIMILTGSGMDKTDGLYAYVDTKGAITVMVNDVSLEQYETDKFSAALPGVSEKTKSIRVKITACNAAGCVTKTKTAKIVLGG